MLILPSLADGSLGTAKRYIAALRYDLAEQELVDVARASDGEEKQEALFLLASLKSSVSETQIIYQDVIRLGPSSKWGESAHVELAKIQYALGNYQESLRILEGAAACRSLQEACYFQGLSAMMLERYNEARETLSRIRRGRYQAWAYLSLADIEMSLDNAEEACDKYRSMARGLINPTAMYRYAECLEKAGDTDEAKAVFEDIVHRFKNTPEAVLAVQKLELLKPA
ncbi:MAG: tetratricopeptide repeat protein, partial [Candidatus Krumholzibacteria bacterium]|nr:tetratricopeptide repeat protein [Candidatus Krumholzibacteria bacterium]